MKRNVPRPLPLVNGLAQVTDRANHAAPALCRQFFVPAEVPDGAGTKKPRLEARASLIVSCSVRCLAVPPWGRAEFSCLGLNGLLQSYSARAAEKCRPGIGVLNAEWGGWFQ